MHQSSSGSGNSSSISVRVFGSIVGVRVPACCHQCLCPQIKLIVTLYMGICTTAMGGMVSWSSQLIVLSTFLSGFKYNFDSVPYFVLFH